MQKVMTFHYGLDGKTPISHCDIAQTFGIKIGTSRHYLENAWKRLSVKIQVQEMRKVLWWKDV
jgi:DNA-binding CsgD family transcriptional regulator